MQSGQSFAGVKVRRGGYDLIQIAMQSGQFTDMAPVVPMKETVAQRGYMASHMRKIAKYIAFNSTKWGFGAISLAIDPDKVVWEPWDRVNTPGVAEFGTLTIKTGYRDSIKILDGQHRRAALGELLNGRIRGINRQRIAAAQRSIQASSLSVDLYLIDNDRDAGQLFSDMAKAKSITLSERATLDARNPFNAAATAILDNKRIPESLAWLSDLVTPPIIGKGLPGPRSLAGKHVGYWLMPHDVSVVMKWRLLPGGRATRAWQDKFPKTRVIEAADHLFNEELPSLRPEWEKIKELNRHTLPQLRKESWVWMPRSAQQAAASLYTYGTNSPDHVALIDWWKAQDLNRNEVTGDHPLFFQNAKGFVSSGPAARGRDIALYLLEQDG